MLLHVQCQNYIHSSQAYQKYFMVGPLRFAGLPKPPLIFIRNPELRHVWIPQRRTFDPIQVNDSICYNTNTLLKPLNPGFFFHKRVTGVNRKKYGHGSLEETKLHLQWKSTKKAIACFSTPAALAWDIAQWLAYSGLTFILQ